MPTADLDAQLAPLADQLASIQEARDMLANREAAVKAQILALTPGPDRYQAGVHQIIVSVSSRVDTHAVAAKYPADQFPQLYSQTVDVKQVRAHFAPVDLEPLLSTSSPSVRLA